MKTTKQDFELFRSECERWIDFFGLKDYEVRFEFKKLEDETQAQLERNFGGADAHAATFILSTAHIFPFPEDRILEIKLCAFHEVCELLLAEVYFSLEEFYSDKYCQKLGHQIIRRLENSVFKNSREYFSKS